MILEELTTLRRKLLELGSNEVDKAHKELMLCKDSLNVSQLTKASEHQARAETYNKVYDMLKDITDRYQSVTMDKQWNKQEDQL